MIIFVINMNIKKLALLSGLLLAFSWPAIGLFPLIFIAFIPLLILERDAENGKQVFWGSFLAFFYLTSLLHIGYITLLFLEQ